MSTQSSGNSLKNNWELIDKSRTSMAKEIASLADSLSGPRERQLKSISRWLNSSQGYDAVLERPDVLCFCQPWVDALVSKPNQESLNKFEAAAAIGIGFCKFENNAPTPRDLTQFLYPAIMFLALLAMITFGSIFLLPHFRKMFAEFGIELPFWTRRIIEWGMWFEAYWMFVFAVVLLLPLVFLIFLRFSQHGEAYSLNWLDRRFARFRTKLSLWATHLASLLSAGVSETEAIQIAGRCSTSANLQDRCDAFAKDPIQGFLDPAEYPLINNSLSLKDRAAKIRILEETARYYQSVSRIVQSWWLTWLAKAILWAILAMLGFVIFSLFAPIISIISGLTS